MSDEPRWKTNRRTGKPFRTASQDSLADVPQPIFGDNLPTQPVIEPYDPDKEAEIAEDYYEQAIINSPSQEEVLGWEQDIAEDARLTNGEKARLKKLAEDQRNLLRISQSGDFR